MQNMWEGFKMSEALITISCPPDTDEPEERICENCGCFILENFLLGKGKCHLYPQTVYKDKKDFCKIGFYKRDE